MKTAILLGILIAAVMSCRDEIDPERAIISYGTSFGHCLGYCITETNISENEITVTKRSRDDKKMLQNFASISDEKVAEIIAGIDIEKFRKLPDTIGCPDCADGGAEWLELSYEGEKRKVTFEYGDDVDGIAEAIDELRKLTEKLAPKVD